MSAVIVHLVGDDDTALCGAALLPESTPPAEANWTEDRWEVTCDDCDTAWAEDHAEDDEQRRANAAEDRLIDYWVDHARGY